LFFEEKGDGAYAGVSLSNLLLGGLQGSHFIGDALM
jgi:hypothetical protein